MTEPKNPATSSEAETNELSEEELEAASGGALSLNQPRINSALSSQKVVAPIDVQAGAVPSIKDSLL